MPRYFFAASTIESPKNASSGMLAGSIGFAAAAGSPDTVLTV